MPQPDRSVVKDRALRLRVKGENALASRLQKLVGTEQDLLVEEPGSARTPCFAHVRVADNSAAGTMMRGRIDAADGRNLYARVLEPARNAVTQAIP